MPKLKTHSGAAKRFKKTGTGKFKRGQSKMRHILTSKATKTKRKLGGSALISDAHHKVAARMIPYACSYKRTSKSLDFSFPHHRMSRLVQPLINATGQSMRSRP